MNMRMKFEGCLVEAVLLVFICTFCPFVYGHIQCFHLDECQSEPNGTFLPCYGDIMSNLSCSYARFLNYEVPSVSPSLASRWDIPGAADNLTLAIYYFDYNGDCYPRLNISWKLKLDGSLKYLKGFMLRLVDLKGIANITRVFKVDFSTDSLTPEQVRATIHYPCITTNYHTGSLYRVTVHSIPASISSAGACLNCVEKYISVPPLDSAEVFDAANTFKWSPEVVFVEVRGDKVVVSFQTAPIAALFRSYRVDLVTTSSQSIYYDYAESIFVNTTIYKLVNVTFFNVLAGVYKVMVRAVSTDDCTCRVGPEPDDCRDVCQATVISPVDVLLDDVMSSLSTTVQPSVTTESIISTTVQPYVTTEWISSMAMPPWSMTAVAPGTSSSVIGIIVGVLSAVFLLGLLAFLLYCKKIQKDPVKLKICLVFTNDSDSHRKVVYKLSDFIKKHCGNDVEVIDILDRNFLKFEEVMTKLRASKRVIIVYSEGRKSDCNIETVESLRSHKGLFDKVIEALVQVENTKQSNLIHVSFHYSRPDLIRNESLGAKFRVIAQLPNLVELLNDGVASACTQCVEGAELFQAFVEAGGLPWYFFETTIVPPATIEPPFSPDNSSINSDTLKAMLRNLETETESGNTSDPLERLMDTLIIHGRPDCCVQRQLSNLQHEIISMFQ